MKKKLAILFAILILPLSGCTITDGQTESSTSSNLRTDLLTYPTKDYMSELGESVQFVDGDEIYITESGTYEFAGEYLSSTITVNVDKEIDEGIVYLILNSAHISSENSTPINIIEAKDVVILLEGENTVLQGEITTDDEEFPSAAIYSKADTVIAGDGALTVTTLYNDGINSRDDLIIENNNITINAVGDGIVGKDLIAVKDANITVDAGKDGLKSSNSEDADKGNIIIVSGDFYIEAENDAISSENIMQIDDGNFELYSGDGYVEVIKTPSSGPVGGGTNGTNRPWESGMDRMQEPADGEAGAMQPPMGGEMSGMQPPMSGEMSGMQPPTDGEMGEIPNSEISGLDIDEQTEETATEESMKALKAINHLIINDGTFNISAYEDAVHSDGDLTVNAGEFLINAGDDAFTSQNTIINSGNIIIENCFEGIEGINVEVNGGDISINTDDDGINGSDQSGGVTISGGNIEIVYGQGGDGIDSNGYYTQTGGDIIISAPEGSDQMNAPLDVDGDVNMSGGTIVDENGNDVEASPSDGGMGGMMPGGNRTMPGGN